MKPIRKRLPWFNLVLLALLIAFLFSALIHHLDMGGGCKESSYNNERQIVLAALVYANDNDGNWPKNLAEIKYEFPDMKAKVFTSPECPASISPFCYVRPVPTAEADQPVLIEDPACERGKGSTICYADGHVGRIAGGALWNQARHLESLHKTILQGADRQDWGLPTVIPNDSKR